MLQKNCESNMCDFVKIQDLWKKLFLMISIPYALVLCVCLTFGPWIIADAQTQKNFSLLEYLSLGL